MIKCVHGGPLGHCPGCGGAEHFDGGKPSIQYLLAMEGLEEVARVGEYGAAKYKDRWNYRKGMPWMKLCGSISRHLRDFILGRDKDKESGLRPLAHLVFDGLMLLEYVTKGIGTDDRYKGIGDEQAPRNIRGTKTLVSKKQRSL